MARDLVKIQASLLRAGRPFAREIFLRLPKNQKMLRIVLSGDEIRPPLLARLLNNPEAEIFAQPTESDPLDALEIDLYGESEGVEHLHGAVADFTKQDFSPGHDLEQETKTSFTAGTTIDGKTKLAASAPAGRENETIGEGTADLQTNRRKRSAAAEQETENRIKADASSGEFLTLVRNEPAEATPLGDQDALGRLLGLTAESVAAYAADPAGSGEAIRESLSAALIEALSEVARQEFAGTELSPVLQKLRDSLGRVNEALSDGSPLSDLTALSAQLSDAVKKFKTQPGQPDDEAAFDRKLEEITPEVSAVKADPSLAGPENETIGEGAADLQTNRRKRSAAAEQDTENRIKADASSGEFLTLVRNEPAEATPLGDQDALGRLLGLTAESVAAYTADPAGSGEAIRESLSAALIEALSEVARQEFAGTELSPVLQKLRDSLGRVNEALSDGSPLSDLTALSAQLSDAVKKFKTQPGQPDDEAAFDRKLEEITQEVSVFKADPSPAENAAELLRDKLTACVEEIDKRLEAGTSSSPTLLTVKSLLQREIETLPETSRIAKAYRDTPQIAARLATLLAHSLGYANPQYLFDMAFTTHLFFADKNGTPLTPAELPPMATVLLAKEISDSPAGTPLGDSAAILHFLERYFENPDCDRTQTEFRHRVFESTLSALPANEWTAARWRYFMDHGASLTALSSCSRASAKASKAVRILAAEPMVESETL